MALKRRPRPPLSSWFTRDRFLLGFGAAGVAWETIVEQGERPTLLILFAACLGFPVFLAADERKQEDELPRDPDPNGEKP